MEFPRKLPKDISFAKTSEYEIFDSRNDARIPNDIQECGNRYGSMEREALEPSPSKSATL